jgi:hypothetical protein
VERTRVEATVNPAPPAPDPAWLLLQRDQLRLSHQQVKKLNQLRGRWERDTQELQAALARASRDFQQQMTTHRRQAITVAELQERARPVTELSRELSVARQAWWEEAAGVLTASQRLAAEQAWARRLREPPDERQQTRKLPVTAESSLYR